MHTPIYLLIGAEEISTETTTSHSGEKTTGELPSGETMETVQENAVTAGTPVYRGMTEEELESFYRTAEEDRQRAEEEMYDLLDKVNEAITLEELNRVLFGTLCNSYDRFECFHSHFLGMLTEDVYWKALRSVYVSSDDLYYMREEVREAFSTPGSRYLLMNEEERQELRELPETVTIYRAMSEEEARSEEYGVSWTLSEKTAVFFRDEYVRNHTTAHLPRTIVRLQIPKSSIVALISERDEQEVIYLG
ncbi:hypothetical protein GCM10023188_27570 [Pontibacter saemangeumensis]|uniref:Uncharacterized protein n=1 Tax=Pontibacter saemangeumensis TaxID=1084525 RepID=A0ABP8LU54_9BACT